MNNKGQVLVLFVLLIPFLLMLGAYIVDTSYISYHNIKVNGINDLVIEKISEENLNRIEIEEYIKRNDKELSIVKLNITDTKIEMTLKKEIKSIFGNIIGKSKYEILSTKTLNITNNH